MDAVFIWFWAHGWFRKDYHLTLDGMAWENIALRHILKIYLCRQRSEWPVAIAINESDGARIRLRVGGCITERQRPARGEFAVDDEGDERSAICLDASDGDSILRAGYGTGAGEGQKKAHDEEGRGESCEHGDQHSIRRSRESSAGDMRQNIGADKVFWM